MSIQIKKCYAIGSGGYYFYFTTNGKNYAEVGAVNTIYSQEEVEEEMLKWIKMIKEKNGNNI